MPRDWMTVSRSQRWSCQRFTFCSVFARSMIGSAFLKFEFAVLVRAAKGQVFSVRPAANKRKGKAGHQCACDTELSDCADMLSHPFQHFHPCQCFILLA